MQSLIFALLVACASAQYVAYPGYHHAGYAYAPAVYTPAAAYHHVTPFVAPYVAKEAIKTEWDEKDGSPKPVKVEAFDAEKKYVAHPYTLPVYPAFHPAYPYAAYPVAVKDEKKEGARNKRDVTAAYPTPFARDFAYSSVDLNQDGQPDNKQFYPYAYQAYPYAAYPYYNHYPKYFY